MKEPKYVSTGTDISRTGVSREELKLKMVEHITSQYDNEYTNYVRGVINETKPGASRRATVMQMVKMVLTAD